MKMLSSRVSVAALVAALLPIAARANIIGFGDLSGFSVNINDTGSSPTVSPGVIHLITGGGDARSVINKTPQSITPFTASFTWQNQTNFHDQGGATFVLENVSGGSSAVGGFSGNLGYSNGTFASNFGKSVAITLETANTPTLTGLYTSGNLGGGSNSTSPVNLASGNPIDVTLTYNGTTLHETLLDTVTLAQFDTTYFINLNTALGAATAYVGVTAGSSSGGASQTFSNFLFINTPEPTTLSILAFAGSAMLLRRKPRNTEPVA